MFPQHFIQLSLHLSSKRMNYILNNDTVGVIHSLVDRKYYDPFHEFVEL